jgi:hypothetical protein
MSSIGTVLVLLLLLIALGLVELFCLLLWFPPYYRVGLPLYRRRLRIEPCQQCALPEPETLAKLFAKGWLVPLNFARLPDGTIGINERMLMPRFDYVPLMHGVIRLDRDNRGLTLTGNANFTVFFLAIFLYAAPRLVAVPGHREPVSYPLWLILGAIGLMYALQVYQYRKVESALRLHLDGQLGSDDDATPGEEDA